MSRLDVVQLKEKEMINRHTNAITMLENEWKTVQELPVGNEYSYRQGLIRNNVLCILNVQANWILLKLPRRYHNNVMGLTLESGRLEMKLRTRKGYLENMWPVVPKHYHTEWDKSTMTHPAPSNMKVCFKCEEVSPEEYIGDVCTLLKEAKTMLTEGTEMHTTATSRNLMQLHYLNSLQNPVTTHTTSVKPGTSTPGIPLSKYPTIVLYALHNLYLLHQSTQHSLVQYQRYCLHH